MQSNEKTLHSLTLEAQKRLSVTGVTDVDAFNETEIRAVTDSSSLLIKGEDLHIEALDLSLGELVVTGVVFALIYSSNTRQKGFFKRMFS